MTTFGSIIRDARTKKGLTLAELALKITTIDGDTVSSQYLCDIEHGRRQPSSGFIVEQFALALDINSDILHYYVGKLPLDIRNMKPSQEQIIEAFQAFRDILNGNDDQSSYVEMPSETKIIKANIVCLGEAMPFDED